MGKKKQDTTTFKTANLSEAAKEDYSVRALSAREEMEAYNADLPNGAEAHAAGVAAADAELNKNKKPLPRATRAPVKR